MYRAPGPEQVVALFAFNSALVEQTGSQGAPGIRCCFARIFRCWNARVLKLLLIIELCPATNGVTTLQQLAALAEKETLGFHGMGPVSIPTLRGALAREGLQFKSGPKE